MFTGIIQHHGVILETGTSHLRLRTTDPDPFVRGESVAVNGVCLTAIPESDGTLLFDVSHETFSRTTLGSIAAGTRVNMERALAVGDRLGGHIVQGHVDTTGALVSVDGEIYRWSFPAEYAELVVSKGSIAVDGVSLTIVEPDATSFGAALIPETLRRTNLGEARVGDAVNLEFDMVAKYIRNLAAPYLAAKR